MAWGCWSLMTATLVKHHLDKMVIWHREAHLFFKSVYNNQHTLNYIFHQRIMENLMKIWKWFFIWTICKSWVKSWLRVKKYKCNWEQIRTENSRCSSSFKCKITVSLLILVNYGHLVIYTHNWHNRLFFSSNVFYFY